MTRRLKFNALAQRDFTAIGPRSELAWGKTRTRRYLDELERQTQRIVENPMLGHDAELPRPRLRRITAGRDVIFYKFDDAQLEIVRILYEAMDFEARLR